MNTNVIPHKDFVVSAASDWSDLYMGMSVALVGFIIYWIRYNKKSN